MAFKMLRAFLILPLIRLEGPTSFRIGMPSSVKNFAFSLPYFNVSKFPDGFNLMDTIICRLIYRPTQHQTTSGREWRNLSKTRRTNR